MLENLDTNIYILIFSSIVIISYFFNSYSKKSGIPAVLMLIGLGIIINLVVGGWDEKFNNLLKLLGTVGLILIVLEAALDLKLLKEKIGIIIKSLLVSIIGLGGTSYIAALFLSFVVSDYSLTQALLITIPLSILSSAIILPSISSLKEKKREFMIYESTFSDIVGIISFYGVLGFLGSSDQNILPETFRDLFFTIIISIVISYVLIYVFQKLKGHAKLFLLISVLLVLYSLGKMMHLSSLIIILIFGLILNNYRLFFKGPLKEFVLEDRVEKILDDFRLVTVESAFVVRTFFFILFGWSIVFSDLLSFKVIGIGIVLLIIIYFVRAFVLFVFNGTYKLEKITPEVFLAPRGLITILLFYNIPSDHINPNLELFRGVLLFVILFSCLIMTWSLIKEKKKLEIKEVVGEEEIDSENMEEEYIEEN